MKWVRTNGEVKFVLPFNVAGYNKAVWDKSRAFGGGPRYIPGGDQMGMDLVGQLQVALDILAPTLKDVEYETILDYCTQQGWCYFMCATNTREGWYIGCTMNAPPHMQTDDDAYRWVSKRADEGSEFHKAALGALAALNMVL